MKRKLKKLLIFITNPRLLLCFLVAWLITNGWSYILFGFGTYFKINWMIAVSSAYLAFLWFPFSPEKIATLIIALVLLKFLFPKDQKTLAVLHDMLERAKEAVRRRKRNREEKKRDK